MIYYKQCVIRKGNTIEVAWLPEVYAHKDDYVCIKEDDGWQVISVSQFRMTYDDVCDYSQEYKHSRKMTDI